MVFAVNNFVRYSRAGDEVDDRLVILSWGIATNDIVLELGEAWRARRVSCDGAGVLGLEEWDYVGLGRLEKIDDAEIEHG